MGKGRAMEATMHPGSESLIGTWCLQSWESRSEDGRGTYPFWPDAVGYLAYTADGYMLGTIACRDRPPFVDPDLRSWSPVEKTAAVDTYLTYCGRYEVREGMAIHHIELSLFPNWIGADHVRFFELEGDRLTITTPP